MSTKYQHLKPQKGSKKKPQLPETDDECLSAGVKEEEAGEKWRAGDAAKSSRFFLRAIDIYDAGLRKHPASFDLAYNKARLQYDFSQQPRLLAHQSNPLIELLHVALRSHRYALTLQRDNADVLFNTAQVMVSIAELFVDNSTDIGTYNRSDASSSLTDAIQIFQRCLDVQSTQFREAETMAMHAEQSLAAPDVSPPPQSSAETETEEQWASVEETVTSSTLLDTCIAEIHAWTILIPLLSTGGSTYSETEAHAMNAVDRASTLPSNEEEWINYQQVTFNLRSSLADYAFKNGLLSSPDYADAVSKTWSFLNRLVSFGPALCDYADALVTLSTTISFDNASASQEIRWQALGTALKSLTQANTNPGPADRISINARRGDVELLRARMAAPPISFEQAIKHKVLLIKNAGTYYEGARKLATAEGDTATADTVLAKSIITKALQEGNMGEVLSSLPPADQSRMQFIIGEMVEEGLIAS